VAGIRFDASWRQGAPGDDSPPRRRITTTLHSSLGQGLLA